MKYPDPEDKKDLEFLVDMGLFLAVFAVIVYFCIRFHVAIQVMMILIYEKLFW